MKFKGRLHRLGDMGEGVKDIFTSSVKAVLLKGITEPITQYCIYYLISYIILFSNSSNCFYYH